MKSVTAAIMAGGRSRRMGRDKAEILWQGETLLARTARVAQQAGCSVIVVGRERPDEWPLRQIRFVPDACPGHGPLGGLATALQAADENVLLLACDMPLLDTQALAWLLGQTPGPHGLAVRNGERWEPLFSIYTPDVMALIRVRLAAGPRSLRSLIDAGEFRAVTPPPEVTATLVNVNTPEELASL